MHRRRFLSSTALGCAMQFMPWSAQGATAFDFSKARKGYLDRIASIKKEGQLPIIDIESSYNPLEIDLPSFAKSMDRAGIAMMCMSVDQPGKLVANDAIWSDHSLNAYQQFPMHFIPIGNGGNHPAWTKQAENFLEAQDRYIIEHSYLLKFTFNTVDLCNCLDILST